ncbi:MAG: ATP-dependent DNA helicase RecG [Candidatus Spechtbacterales bacterium]
MRRRHSPAKTGYGGQRPPSSRRRITSARPAKADKYAARKGAKQYKSQMELSTPVENIKTIGSVYAKRLKKLGIKEAKDLLFHFPSRYEDYSKISPIGELKKDDVVTVRGKIMHVSERRVYRKNLRIVEAYIEDRTDSLRVVWFNQSYIKSYLNNSSHMLLAGTVSLGKEGLYMSNPTYETERTDRAPVHAGRVVPIYPATRGITSRWLRNAIYQLLPHAENVQDPMPKHLISDKKFPPIKNALQQIHFPGNQKQAEEARRRFEFEEIFYIQLAALRAKADMQREISPKIKSDIKLTKKFLNSLPFKLTDSQKKSSWQILKDLEKPNPMNRLLEGDVGSGKTIVAAIAALNTIKTGFQTAYMAPTEILAEQHFLNLRKIFGEFNPNISIALYTRGNRRYFLKGKEEDLSKEKIKKHISDGKIDFIIGTHTLAQDGVKFKKLGLIVVDEQHRFGVKQRAALAKKEGRTGKKELIPNFLSMTATPIPRSLALTIYGDLDISLLKEMPGGRKKVITKIVPPQKRTAAYEFIKDELKKGRQAFVVVPLIEYSEKLEAKSAKEEYEKLSKGPFSDYAVGLLHGKMKAEEKERIMRDVKENKIQVLVSTSVVEVGIDIPNATIMMVEGADRFGLAQLHQFRGRVGRDKHQSYCFLLTDSNSQNTLHRVRALTKAQNGFDLAEYDLSIRGAGELYGARQSGMPDFAMASLTNVALIEEARESAHALLEKDPKLKKWPELKERVEQIQNKMHFE